MISEVTFVSNYTSFWNELLPGSERYVRMINAGLKEIPYEPIKGRDSAERRAIVNDMGFGVYRAVAQGRLRRADARRCRS